MPDGSVPSPPAIPDADRLVDRLVNRPWRIMEWREGVGYSRFAACVDAYPTWTGAVAALPEHPGAWIESAPEDVIPTS